MLLKLFAEGEHRVPLAPAVFAEMQMLLKLMLQIIRQLAVLGEDYVLLCTLTVHDAYSNQPLQRTSQSIIPQRIFLTALPASGASSSLLRQRTSTSLARSLRVARKRVFLAVSSVVESISPIVLSFSPW